MFGISGIEFLFIALLILILFGPDKLPQFGRTIGRVIRQFNEAKDQMEGMMRGEMYGSDAKSPFGDLSSPFAPPAKSEAAADTPKAPREFADDEEEEEEE